MKSTADMLADVPRVVAYCMFRFERDAQACREQQMPSVRAAHVERIRISVEHRLLGHWDWQQQEARALALAYAQALAERANTNPARASSAPAPDRGSHT